MSRAKAKLAVIHDLQGKQPGIILTKKDCDIIADALIKSQIEFDKIKGLYCYLKDLSKT